MPQLAKHHQMMVDDGFPAELLLTPAQRKAWWDKHPPKHTAFAAPATGEPNKETTDMATKKKGKGKAKKPAAKANGAGNLRAGSKQEVIYNLLTRKSGCTTEDALKATGWDKCGVSTWGKKFGLKVTKEKAKDGTTRYYGAAK